MKLSLVVPCYNEAENIRPFQEAAIEAFKGCGYDFEIVYVDDGSKDATLHNLKKLHSEQLCPIKVISFSRNFGKEAALFAGLEKAEGEYICFIDADLQQRPETVRDMVRILDEEPKYDVVAAYQDRRREGKVLSFFKKSFYAIINKRFDISRLFGDGGMPSGHSATVTSMALLIGLVQGFGSVDFAISFILAVIVCHDATGVRLETEKQAFLITEMVKAFSELTEDKLPEVKLKQFVGHTPIQVLAGITVGIANAFLLYWLMF